MWDDHYRPFLCGDIYAFHTVGLRNHIYDFLAAQILRPPSKYVVRLNNTAYNSIQFNNGIGMSNLETKEVYSGSTQLDISYATFYEGHLPCYGRCDIWSSL